MRVGAHWQQPRVHWQEALSPVQLSLVPATAIAALAATVVAKKVSFYQCEAPYLGYLFTERTDLFTKAGGYWGPGFNSPTAPHRPGLSDQLF